MGRHSSGKNNYRLSGGAVLVLVVVLALLAALVWFLANRGGDDRAAGSDVEPACVSGELSLPIASDNAEVADELIEAYAASSPVVRDFCIAPELSGGLDEAAVYIAPNTPVSHQRLAQAGRTAAVADPEPVYADVVGLAGSGDAPEDIGADSVRYPTDTPSASALVAALLASDDNAAVEALSNHRVGTAGDAEGGDGVYVAASQSQHPDGMTFTPLDASVVYAAIPLNSGGTIDENQARAGQDFARFAADAFAAEDFPEQPMVSELVWAAALPAGGEAVTADGDGPTDADDAAVAADGEVTDTLFLLDTSDAMAPFIQAAKEGVAQAAGEVAEQGHQVALWNYSSPLTPGVAQGYRRNIALTANAADVQDSVARFLTGGVPHTREAVTAAVSALPGPARVVLITTGTADGGEDAAFEDAVRAATQAGLSLSVVHVGDGPVDSAVGGVATSRQQAGNPDELVAAIVAATGTRS